MHFIASQENVLRKRIGDNLFYFTLRLETLQIFYKSQLAHEWQVILGVKHPVEKL